MEIASSNYALLVYPYDLELATEADVIVPCDSYIIRKFDKNINVIEAGIISTEKLFWGAMNMLRVIGAFQSEAIETQRKV